MMIWNYFAAPIASGLEFSRGAVAGGNRPRLLDTRRIHGMAVYAGYGEMSLIDLSATRYVELPSRTYDVRPYHVVDRRMEIDRLCLTLPAISTT